MTHLTSELKLNAVMRLLLRKMIDPLNEDSFYDQLSGGGNSPGWILGHLVVVNRFGHSMLGGPALDPAELEMFGPGSSPELSASKCPSKQKLQTAEEETAAALIAAVQAADAILLRT